MKQYIIETLENLLEKIKNEIKNDSSTDNVLYRHELYAISDDVETALNTAKVVFNYVVWCGANFNLQLPV